MGTEKELTMDLKTVMYVEPPLTINPLLATCFGFNESVFIQQLGYWLGKSAHIHDGKRWVYNTYEQWQEQFPWLSVIGIRKIFNRLEKQGIIQTAHLSSNPMDRTLWYTLNLKFRVRIPSSKEEQYAHLSELTNGEKSFEAKNKADGVDRRQKSPVSEKSTRYKVSHADGTKDRLSLNRDYETRDNKRKVEIRKKNPSGKILPHAAPGCRAKPAEDQSQEQEGQNKTEFPLQKAVELILPYFQDNERYRDDAGKIARFLAAEQMEFWKGKQVSIPKILIQVSLFFAKRYENPKLNMLLYDARTACLCDTLGIIEPRPVGLAQIRAEQKRLERFYSLIKDCIGEFNLVDYGQWFRENRLPKGDLISLRWMTDPKLLNTYLNNQRAN